MRKVKVAATQMKCTWDRDETLKNAEKLVRQAAKEGANIILLQELFETPYFCHLEKYEYIIFFLFLLYSLIILFSIEDNFIK